MLGQNRYLKFLADDINDILERLKRIPHSETYKKEDIPNEYHYKHNPRIGDLILILDPGYELHRHSFRMIILLFSIGLFSILK